MPLYDYQCPKCGAEFEAFARIADRDTMRCSTCGKLATRLITGGSFMLLGGGWTGTGHAKVVPPDSRFDSLPKPDAEGYHTRYYNCTPESVHRGK